MWYKRISQQKEYCFSIACYIHLLALASSFGTYEKVFPSIYVIECVHFVYNVYICFVTEGKLFDNKSKKLCFYFISLNFMWYMCYVIFICYMSGGEPSIYCLFIILHENKIVNNTNFKFLFQTYILFSCADFTICTSGRK